METQTLILPYILGTLGGVVGASLGLKISRFARGRETYEQQLYDRTPQIRDISNPQFMLVICAAAGTMLGQGFGSFIGWF